MEPTAQQVAQKSCSTCKELKPVFDFSGRKASPDGLGYRCRPCVKKAAHANYEANKPYISKRNKQWADANPEKVRQAKRKWSEAHPDHNRERYERRKAADPSFMRGPWLKKHYGLSITQYEEMLTAQSGRCGLCGGTDWGRKGPCVDHDHATGKVRALLCVNCNLGLGHFQDNPERLASAIDYVRRHSGALGTANGV
jgi:hypothetical protein